MCGIDNNKYMRNDLFHDALFKQMPDIYGVGDERAMPNFYHPTETDGSGNAIEFTPEMMGGPAFAVQKQPVMPTGPEGKTFTDVSDNTSGILEAIQNTLRGDESIDSGWESGGPSIYQDEKEGLFVRHELPQGHFITDDDGESLTHEFYVDNFVYHPLTSEMATKPPPDEDELNRLTDKFAKDNGHKFVDSDNKPVVGPSVVTPVVTPAGPKTVRQGNNWVSSTTGEIVDTDTTGTGQRKTQQTSWAGERPDVKSEFKTEKIRQHLLNSGISENEVDDYIDSFDDNAFDKYYYAHVDSALRGEAAPKISDSPERQEKIDRIRQLNREQHQVDIYDDNHFKYMPDAEVDKLLISTNEKYAEHQRQTTKQERVRTSADIKTRMRDMLPDAPTEAQLNQRATEILGEKLVNAPIWADNSSHPDVKEAKDHFKALVQDLQSKAEKLNLDPLGNMAARLAQLPPNQKVNFLSPQYRQQMFVEDSQKQRDETEYAENLNQAYANMIAENGEEAQNAKNFVQLFRNDDGTYRTRLVNPDNPLAFMEGIPGDEEGEISNFINQADIPSIADLTSGENHKQGHSKEEMDSFNNLPFYHPATDSWIDPVELRNSYVPPGQAEDAHWLSINGFQHAGRKPEEYSSKKHQLFMAPQGHIYNHEFPKEHRNLADASFNSLISDMHTSVVNQYGNTSDTIDRGDVTQPSERTMQRQADFMQSQQSQEGSALDRVTENIAQGGRKPLTPEQFDPSKFYSRAEMARYRWRENFFNPRNFLGTFLDIRKPNQLLDDRLRGSQQQLHADMQAYDKENKINEAYRQLASEGMYDAQGDWIEGKDPDTLSQPNYYGSTPRALARAKADQQQAEDARTAGMEQAKKADQYAQESSQQPEQQPEQQIEQQPSGLNLNRFWEQPQQPQQPQQSQESQPQTQPTLNLNRFWENK